MGPGAGLSWWGRLRDWNARSAAWMDNPPWRNGLILAALAAGMETVASHLRDGEVHVAWTAFAAAVFFAAGTAAAVRRNGKRAGIDRRERSADVPRPGDPLDSDDGRRWRSGIG